MIQVQSMFLVPEEDYAEIYLYDKMIKEGSLVLKQMVKPDNIIDAVMLYHPTADVDLIRKAYVFSAQVHAGQVRQSGEPFLNHPLEVAKILADLKLDEASICTGLLHDTVEDTLATLEDIEHIFGKDIAMLVDGVTKLSQVQFQSSEDKRAENFRKMLVAMSRDIRVLLVKLADRLHNMRTLQHMPSHKQETVARETLEIYAPLANRLGIHWMKAELEDLSLKYLWPTEFRDLKEKVGITKKERDKFIHEVSSSVRKFLKEAGLKDFEVSGRSKHLWSIYRKMVDKNLSFEEITDLIAFRVLVGTVGQCYEALGYLHAFWKPIPGRFKDYIAMPKPNGYRSLHTTLIGPEGKQIEIQIRTRDMHEVAESGIAAHWKYKETGGEPIKPAEAESQGFLWLRQLMDWQRELKDPSEFLESVKVDLFADEVYVFTPKGDVIELPRGSTAVDFAFAIHSNVGFHCASAKVNNKIVPLRHVLENGDVCEIVIQKSQVPRKDWLEFVQTSRARNKIRTFIRQREREKSIEIGREMLEKESRRYGINWMNVCKMASFETTLKEMHFKNTEDCLAAVGYGKTEAKVVLESIFSVHPENKLKEEQKTNRIAQLFDRIAKKQTSGVRIGGIDNILIHYARCCSPVKGDPVVGFITRGRGLSIHRRDCQKVFGLDVDRRVAVAWDEKTEVLRPVLIRVVTEDKEGILTQLSSAFARLGINISEAKIKTNAGQAICLFKCVITDSEQLRHLLKMLSSVKGVQHADRERLEEF